MPIYKFCTKINHLHDYTVIVQHSPTSKHHMDIILPMVLYYSVTFTLCLKPGYQ